MQSPRRNPPMSQPNSRTGTRQHKRTNAWLEDSLRKRLRTGALSLGQAEEYAIYAAQTQGNPVGVRWPCFWAKIRQAAPNPAYSLRSFDFAQ